MPETIVGNSRIRELDAFMLALLGSRAKSRLMLDAWDLGPVRGSRLSSRQSAGIDFDAGSIRQWTCAARSFRVLCIVRVRA
jgi:hypothetical protein